MMGETQDQKTKSKWSKGKTLGVVGGLAGAISIIISVGVLYFQQQKYNKFISEEVQESGRSIEEIIQYSDLLGSKSRWDRVSLIAEKADLSTLKLLLSDREIIKKAEDVSDSVRGVVRGVLHEKFVYKKDTGRIVSMWDIANVDNAIYRGYVVKVGNFDPNEYLTLRSKSKLGIFTMFAANVYGISTPDLLKIPGKPDENYFFVLETAKVPAPYSLQGLLQGKNPGEIVREYEWETAYVSYGARLEDLLKVPYKTTKEDFNLLKKEEIPVRYSIPGMQQGHTAEEIVEKYAIEEIGVSAEVRREYRAISMPHGKRLTDDQVRVLVSGNLNPEYFEQIAQEGLDAITTAFNLIKQGKLNEEKWREFWPEFSVDDTLCALENCYTREFALRVRVVYGTSLVEFHKDRQQYEFMGEFLKGKNPQPQPMLNNAPK